jgi:hypothetical protein
MYGHDMPPPNTGSKTFTLRIPAAVMANLKKASEERRKPIAALLLAPWKASKVKTPRAPKSGVAGLPGFLPAPPLNRTEVVPFFRQSTLKR